MVGVVAVRSVKADNLSRIRNVGTPVEKRQRSLIPRSGPCVRIAKENLRTLAAIRKGEINKQTGQPIVFKREAS